jgi:hypothetical protein
MNLLDINHMYRVLGEKSHGAKVVEDGQYVNSTSNNCIQSKDEEFSLKAIDRSNYQSNSKVEFPLQRTLSDLWDQCTQDKLDMMWSRAIYTPGLPFNIVNNNFFRQAVEETTRGHCQGYIVPTMNRLRNKLLTTHKQEATASIKKVLDQCNHYGFFVSSDG